MPAASRKPLCHYDTSRVVDIVGRAGDTWRVRYLDGTEADVKADRVGQAMNSYVLMEPGDLTAGSDRVHWIVFGRYKVDAARLERLADDSCTWEAPTWSNGRGLRRQGRIAEAPDGLWYVRQRGTIVA